MSQLTLEPALWMTACAHTPNLDHICAVPLPRQPALVPRGKPLMARIFGMCYSPTAGLHGIRAG